MGRQSQDHTWSWVFWVLGTLRMVKVLHYTIYEVDMSLRQFILLLNLSVPRIPTLRTLLKSGTYDGYTCGYSGRVIDLPAHEYPHVEKPEHPTRAFGVGILTNRPPRWVFYQLPPAVSASPQVQGPQRPVKGTMGVAPQLSHSWSQSGSYSSGRRLRSASFALAPSRRLVMSSHHCVISITTFVVHPFTKLLSSGSAAVSRAVRAGVMCSYSPMSCLVSSPAISPIS